MDNNFNKIFEEVFEQHFSGQKNKIIQEEVEKRGWILGSVSKVYIRFSTKPIKDFIHYNKTPNGWKNGESFLFEIEL